MVAAACLPACVAHAVFVAQVAFIDGCAACLFFGLGIFGLFGFGFATHAAWFADGIAVWVPWADSALFLGLLACEAGG